jgi:starch phosphorylase
MVMMVLHHADLTTVWNGRIRRDCRRQVSEAYGDQKNWTRMSILNSARVGRFSSDRSIREYCRDIWNVQPATTAER